MLLMILVLVAFLATLKLLDIIDWPWAGVIAPVVVVPAFVVFAIAFVVICAGVFITYGGKALFAAYGAADD